MVRQSGKTNRWNAVTRIVTFVKNHKVLSMMLGLCTISAVIGWFTPYSHPAPSPPPWFSDLKDANWLEVHGTMGNRKKLEFLQVKKFLNYYSPYFSRIESLLPNTLPKCDWLYSSTNVDYLWQQSYHDQGKGKMVELMYCFHSNDPWGTPFNINGKNGTIRSAGPDKLFGPKGNSGDDIITSFRSNLRIKQVVAKANEKIISLHFSKELNESLFTCNLIKYEEYAKKTVVGDQILGVKQTKDLAVVEVFLKDDLPKGEKYALEIISPIFALDGSVLQEDLDLRQKIWIELFPEAFKMTSTKD